MPESKTPFERLHVDLAVSLPETDSGCTELAVFVDSLTGYVITVPLTSRSTREFAQAFVDHVVLVHGPPSALMSDRGGTFLSGLMTEVRNVFKMRQMFTSGYNPQCNGTAENAIRTIISKLAKAVAKKQKNWDTIVRAVTYWINVTPSTVHGYSPFYLMYGRLPVHFEDMRLLASTPQFASVDAFVAETMEDLHAARQIVSEMREDSKDQYVYKGKEFTTYKTGDRVSVYQPSVSPDMKFKLHSVHYKPGYTVTRALPNNIDYEVTHSDGDKRIVKVTRLKRDSTQQ